MEVKYLRRSPLGPESPNLDPVCYNAHQCTLKLDRREGGPELIIMFSDYDTTASKLSCDEIPLVQSFQPIGNELTFCVL